MAILKDLTVLGNESVIGELRAATIKKNGGTANQFLKADGSVDESTFVDELQTSVTWSELKTLRDSSGLTPGMWYRITDYQTTTTQANTSAATNVFDVIVLATDVNKLSEEARATKRSGDTYFTTAGANLEAWKIWYCLDNDTTRFAWAVTGSTGRGVIYRMIDEWNNDCPYDFKNIQFARWEQTNPVGYIYDEDEGDYVVDSDQSWVSDYNIKAGFYSINGGSNDVKLFYDDDLGEYKKKISYIVSSTPTYCYTFGRGLDASLGKKVYGNVIKEYYSSNKLQLNNIVFLQTSLTQSCNFNTFGNNCDTNTFGDNCDGNTFGNYCQSNTFGNNCYSNTIDEYCSYNTFGNYCGSNTFGGGCQSNTFGDSCSYNTIDEYCFNNIFGNSCDYNTIGKDCSYNTFGNYCQSNTFGNNCYSNTFVNDSNNNTFGNSCNSNTFGSGCQSNTFGNSCNSNTFWDDCGYNTFGNGCYSNTFVNDSNDNTFGTGCYSNTFGDSCGYNTFGCDCYSNTFGDGCGYNTFGNSCNSNTLGNSCWSNTFGNDCGYNTFGRDCHSNTFGDSCDNIKFGNASSTKSYCSYNIVENGNQYIYINATGTTASNTQYRNVKIAQGVNNTTTYKTITDGNVNQTFQTVYQPANSQVINV